MYEAPLSPHLLERRGLFSFSKSAMRPVQEFVDELEAVRAAQPSRELAELVHLTAAEYSLAPLFADPRQILPLREPLPVDPQSVSLALMKADCVSMEWCAEHWDASRLTLADVTAFSGDIAKLESLGVSAAAPPSEIGEIARVVDQLEHRHRAQPGLARRVGDSGLLRLQGFLWAVKLALPSRALDQAMADSFEAFELSEPVSGTTVVAH